MPIPQLAPFSVGTLAYPIIQEILGNPGPYKSSEGKYFIFSTECASDGSTLSLIAYKSDDGSAGSYTRIPDGIEVYANNTACVYYPGTGDFVYFGYVDLVDSFIKFVAFKMTTGGIWQSVHNSGISPSPSPAAIGTMWIITSGTNVYISWDSVSDGLHYIYWNGASWSSQVDFVGAGDQMLPMTARAGGKAAQWSCDSGARGNHGAGSFYYSVLDGATIVSTSVALTLPDGDNRVVNLFNYSGYYDAISDSSVLALPMFLHSDFTQFHALLIASPTATPSFTLTTVAAFNDVDFTGWPWLTGNASGDSFSLFWYRERDSDGEDLIEFSTAPSLTGPWAPAILYYDQEANPPTPTPIFDGLFPLSANTLADGTVLVLVGMTENIPSPPKNFCGILFTWAPEAPVSQTLQLNKVVVGGSASPSDFTLTAMGNDSPATILSGPGPQVGPTAVPAITYDLSEGFGPTWNDATGTWASNGTQWDGGYVAGAWVCTGGGSMPNDHTIIVPMGATIVCTITNTAPIPPPFNPTPCSGVIPPAPSTDTQFELRRVYAAMKPAPRIPVRGGS